MHQLLDEQVLRIMNVLNNRVRLVGGCVRDYLLNRAVKDIDMATPLPPQEVMRLLQSAGMRVVPTGLKHGTVTAVIDHRPFEITTLRRDLETDGRHATVGWTADYAADAARRDFTVNALYMDQNGHIEDYVGGLADLKKRRVRFIGDPAARIREDYLRILRYFRFWSLMDTHPADPVVKKVLCTLKDGLKNVSKERKTMEFLKILTTPRVVDALKLMRQTGVLTDIVGAAHLIQLQRFLKVHPSADAMERLAVLTKGATGILCLSNAQKEKVAGCCRRVVLGRSLKQDKIWCTILKKDIFHFHVYCAWAQGRLSEQTARDYLKMTLPPFPVRAADLIAHGVQPGVQMGRMLKKAEQIWWVLDFPAEKKLVIQELLSYTLKNNKRRKQ